MGEFLRLYLEHKELAKMTSRKELVKLITEKLDVSAAKAYDYANAIRVLLHEENRGESPLKRSWRPLPIARPRNRQDAIKLMAGMVEPPLIMKMKEYGLNLWKDLFLGGGPIVCDRNVFANQLGLLIEKVGNVALLDPDFAHAPKALTEACFVKAMEIMNPFIEIHGVNPDENALHYVEWVLRYEAKRQKKTKPNESPISQDVYPLASRPTRIEAIYNSKRSAKSNYLRGLNMWFVLSGEPIANALINYCYDRGIYWQEAVRNLLSQQLKEEGYSETP